MFGVSLTEVLLILLLILIVFGPERLPEAARGLGKLLATLKGSTEALRQELKESLEEQQELLQDLSAARKDLEQSSRELENILNDDSPEQLTAQRGNEADKVQEPQDEE